MDQTNLVFLISQPRAGSTLLQKILDSHSEVVSPPEPWLMLPLSLIRNKNYNVDYDSDLSSKAINQFMDRIPNQGKVYQEAVRNFVFTIYGEYLKRNEARLFIDKTPRYYHILDYLSNIFPKAKFIVLLRHPLDIFVSLRDTFCGGNDQATFKRSGDSVIGAQKIAQFLKKPVEHRKLVRYEDLVSNPNKIISDLCSFLDIKYEPNMINYGKFKHENGLFGDPKINKNKSPHSKSVGKWQSKLNVNTRNLLVQKITPQVIADLGYKV